MGLWNINLLAKEMITSTDKGKRTVLWLSVALLTFVGWTIFLHTKGHKLFDREHRYPSNNVSEANGSRSDEGFSGVTSKIPSKTAQSYPILDSDAKNGKYQQLMKIAHGSGLSLVNSETLELNDALVALAEFEEPVTSQLKGVLKSFINEVETAEINAAYIEVDPLGNEEIKIPPLDLSKYRRDFLQKLKGIMDSDVAKFVVDLSEYDSHLKMSGSAASLYITDGIDGKPRLKLESSVMSANAQLGSESYVQGGVVFASKNTINVETYAEKGPGPRYEKLFMNSGSFPRKDRINLKAE